MVSSWVRGTSRRRGWGRLGPLAAVVAIGATLVAPGAWATTSGAATLAVTPVALYTNASALIGFVVNDGTHVWGEGSGGCAASRAPNSIVEFSESGSFQALFALPGNPGSCDGYLPIASNGAYVVTVSNRTIYVLDVATSTVAAYDESAVFAYADTSPQSQYSIALSATTAYVSSMADGKIVGLDLASGTATVWSTPTTELPRLLEMVGGQLVTLVWQANNNYYEWMTFDPTTGALANVAPTTMTSENDQIAVAVEGIDVYAVDGANLYEYAAPDFTVVAHATLPSTTLFAVADVNGSLWATTASFGSYDQFSPSTLALENAYQVRGAYAPAWLVGAGSTLLADDASYGALVSLATSATVRAPTSTALVAASASPVFGAPDTLTATVSVPGAVTFSANGRAIPGCASVPATTTATCAWSPATVGAVTLGASLAPGNASDAPSTSSALAVTVQPAASTVRVVVSGPGSVAVTGAPLTLTASVSTPGTVTFSANGRTIPGCLGVPAPASTATCVWRPAAPGSLRVAAALAPSSPDYAPSSQGVTFPVVVARRALQVGPFATGGAALTAGLVRQVAAAAAMIARDGYTVVRVFGHDRSGGVDGARGRARARAVADLLRRDLAARAAGRVHLVVAVGARGFPSVTVVAGL